MDKIQATTIENTTAFVQKTLAEAEGGHDWWHILRVVNNAKHIALHENVDPFIVELGALLHDIADAKFHNGDEDIGPKTARQWLESQKVAAADIDHVENIVRHISFKGNLDGQRWMSPELAVVQDADRLDALGAIGIGRVFMYSGHAGYEMWNPDKPPKLDMTKEERKKSNGSSINHFYEKLLLLKDLMNTKTGKELAAKRHDYMEQYLEQFYAEWNGEK